MPYYFPENIHPNTRIMLFVDGENLAIRYKKLLGGEKPQGHVRHLPDVYVWSEYANFTHHKCEIIRKHYYTALSGDQNKITSVIDDLKNVGIEAPRVFKKNGERSKRVDITLASEMLTHAHRRNYDLAVLVTGDEDYVPLVEAVQSEGRRVALWFIENGLSQSLKRAVDHFFNLEEIFLKDDSYIRLRY